MKSVQRRWRFLAAFGGVVIVIALVLTACGSTTTSSGQSPSTTPATTPTATSMPSPTPITHLRPGQNAEFAGRWKISVGDVFPVATSAEHSLVVVISMTNIASVSQYEDCSTDWSLTDNKGNPYQQLSTADVQARGSALSVGTVEPNAAVSGMIVFTVPQPSGLFILTFSSGGLTASWDIHV